jgi:hypothetical protein
VRKFRGVVIGRFRRPKTRHVEVAVERPLPQRKTLSNTSRSSRLEGGPDASVGLVTQRVTGVLEHLCSRPSRGVDTVAKPAGRRKKILAAFGSSSNILVRVACIGPGCQQLGNKRWVAGGDLVDSPHAHRRFAKLGDEGGRGWIGRPELSHQ